MKFETNPIFPDRTMSRCPFRRGRLPLPVGVVYWPQAALTGSSPSKSPVLPGRKEKDEAILQFFERQKGVVPGG
jgi:hypothetical protein